MLRANVAEESADSLLLQNETVYSLNEVATYTLVQCKSVFSHKCRLNYLPSH